MFKNGAKPGCAVTIGDMTFDWEPQTPAGIDMPLTGRGTDIRLEQSDRIGASNARPRGANGASRERGRVTSAGSTHSSAHREAIRTARSVVVKIGTTALTTPSGVFDAGRLAVLVEAIEGRMRAL
ncbi:hypothetical protein MALV_55010 [Mycolicibacterium alvei]|uniref:Aspartate/glutamate/uridylate kinase domain-containing protein n=1 Tax=Mycolicibacterium alvei TaxID=67081 RepID=A0A6N4UZ55_9MYCO|nr:hypothetical protein MALV_55010 [Mycolicibacterium alvei]